MSGVPMTPTDYAAAQSGVEKAAEYAAVQAKLDAGHEFAALMEPGGSVFVSGEWREIVAVTAESDNRVSLVCTDCTEWLARRTATRRYHPPAPSDEGGAA